MSDLIAQIAQLEERLLGTWTRRPSLRAAWTPEPAEFFTVRSQAVAGACRSVADLAGNDLGTPLVMALASAGKLGLWETGSPVVAHDDESDPIRALARWRELRSLQALQKGLHQALAAIGPSSDLSTARGRVHEALAAADAQAATVAYSDEALMSTALEAATVRRVAGYATGFGELDEVTGGLRPGHVWVLGAPTNWGKSSWLLALVDHCRRICGRRALFVTAEDAPELLGTRLLCRRAGLPGRAARDGRLTAQHLARASDEVVAARARGAGPVMLDGRGRDVEHLAGDIRAATRAHGIEIVVVDYLQCIGTARTTQDRRSEINHIARTLTDAIKTSGAAGVLASQLTGEDIRESRDVEHAAEVVLIGRREPDPPHALKLFIKKNKVGAKDAVIDLEWDNLNGSFRTDTPVDYGDQRWDSPSDPRPEEWHDFASA
jgi:hypothetical protein